MTRPKRRPTVSHVHNGLVKVESYGPFGWFLALTAGLPRSGMTSSRLELRDGPNGERWTRHLRPGRVNTAVSWKDENENENENCRLVERLGPVLMHFHTAVKSQQTQLRLDHVTIGPFMLPRALIAIEADAAVVDNDHLQTVVEMRLLGGYVGKLAYTAILLTEEDN